MRSAPSALRSIAFGGFNWALDGAASPVAAVGRLEPAMASAAQLASGRRPAVGLPAREIRFRDVTFAYPGGATVLDGFDLTIPAGSSLAIVGQNGAGKTTLAKLLCRLYDPQAGAIEVDGIDLRDLDITAWRSRLAAVFQDFIRLELPLRDNVAPGGAPDTVVLEALDAAAAANLAHLDTILARGYEGGTDLSGGQWQRVALARALCAVTNGRGRRAARRADRAARRPRRGGDLRADAGRDAALHDHPHLSPLLDGPPRRSDLRAREGQGRRAGHARRADGARNGRYRTMFELQAQRFSSEDEEGQKL